MIIKEFRVGPLIVRLIPYDSGVKVHIGDNEWFIKWAEMANTQYMIDNFGHFPVREFDGIVGELCMMYRFRQVYLTLLQPARL